MRFRNTRQSFTNLLIPSEVRIACIALLVGCVFTIGDVSLAQAPARGQGVAERARPDYEARGIRLGSFVAYPAAEVRFGYDDNVFSGNSGKRDDAVFTLAPSFRIESDWTRHFLSFAADSSSVLFASESDEQHTDWGVAGNGRLNLLASSDITAAIRFQNLTEDRGAIDGIRVVREPTEYDRLEANATWNHRFNRVSMSLGSTFTRFNFDDSPRIGGGKVDQDFRDRNVVSGAAQVGYEFSPGQNAFVRGTVNDRDYDKSTPAVAFNRDSLGFEIVTGWSSGITNVMNGEVYVGYLDQNYESGALRDVGDVSFGMNLDWFVTERTTVTGSVSREVVESTTPGAGGILVSTGSIGVDHELMRNVLLDGAFTYERSRFKGTSRNDDWIRAEVGVKYLLNRYVHLDLDYALENRESNRSGVEFLRNRVSMGFKGQF